MDPFNTGIHSLIPPPSCCTPLTLGYAGGMRAGQRYVSSFRSAALYPSFHGFIMKIISSPLAGSLDQVV